jgi:hypothetical protein
MHRYSITTKNHTKIRRAMCHFFCLHLTMPIHFQRLQRGDTEYREALGRSQRERLASHVSCHATIVTAANHEATASSQCDNDSSTITSPLSSSHSLDQLMQLDERVRQARYQLEQGRRHKGRIKHSPTALEALPVPHQSSISSTSTIQEDTPRKTSIVELEKEYNDAIHDFRKVLWKVPNILIDDCNAFIAPCASTHDRIATNGVFSKQQKPSRTTRDVMFEIQGYEQCQGPLEGCLLTGLGAELCQAVYRYLLDSINNFDIKGIDTKRASNLGGDHQHSNPQESVRTWHVPSRSFISPHAYHDSWGCHSPCLACNALENTPACRVPTWRAFLQPSSAIVPNRLLDRELPQLHVLCIHPTPSIVDTCNDTQQETHISNHKKKKPVQRWYQQVSLHAFPCPTELQLLFLTGYSLEVDSRPLQHQWMDYMHQCFQTLVPHASLRIRPVAPHELAGSEASRWVLESTSVPLSHNANGFSDPDNVLVLASMSHCTDYVSAHIRHGNTGQAVHVLHGTLGPVPHIVEWMLQHSATCTEGVHLPSVLQLSRHCTIPTVATDATVSPHPALIVIPYRRRLTMSSKGRPVVEIFTEKAMPTAKTDDHTKSTTLAAAPKQQEQGLLSPHVLKPSLEQIQLEALSCPFSFLPFFTANK